MTVYDGAGVVTAEYAAVNGSIGGASCHEAGVIGPCDSLGSTVGETRVGVSMGGTDAGHDDRKGKSDVVGSNAAGTHAAVGDAVGTVANGRASVVGRTVREAVTHGAVGTNADGGACKSHDAAARAALPVGGAAKVSTDYAAGFGSNGGDLRSDAGVVGTGAGGRDDREGIGVNVGVAGTGGSNGGETRFDGAVVRTAECDFTSRRCSRWGEPFARFSRDWDCREAGLAAACTAGCLRPAGDIRGSAVRCGIAFSLACALACPRGSRAVSAGSKQKQTTKHTLRSRWRAAPPLRVCEQLRVCHVRFDCCQ
eukprot:NODE_8402_length_1498_cov_4.212983.p1 GENE.NODE_8402_length_1498_cov_4.212983~~NODE_8402_length_1498_cov_4.212983.p1  ORF type:complete len:310 (+),score=29.88 NODE_8402_length_1498_cov_4.212983:440-1369(+)